MLAQPLPDAAAWTRFLTAAPIPILASTAEELQQLAGVEARHGNVDAHLVDQAVSGDPLMTLQVLVHAARHRTRLQVTDVHTVTAAVVLMGIGQFFQAFRRPLTLEQHLADHPAALTTVHRLITRSWRSARLVTAFALQRGDAHAAALQMAALLQGCTEILLWCHAAPLARTLAERRAAEPESPREDIERAVLNVALDPLEQALARAWHWPELLRRLTDVQDRRSQVLLQPQRQMLGLAARLAERLDTNPEAEPTLDEREALADLLAVSTASATRLVRNALA